ncbi:diguanylate cyclase domain protein, partial [Acinetobacter baumannii 1465485]
MMVDIDFFKPYNDSLGHLKGDQCLKDIATAISSIAARS